MATQTDKQTQKVTKSKGYKRMSTKKEVVGKGVFQAELDEFFKRELAEDGYSGIEVRKGPSKSEIIVMATRTQSVLGEGSRRIRELASVIRKRFGFEENDWQLYAERVPFRGLCAIAQCESLRYKLTAGIAVRRACYGVVRYIMDSGANGCEVVVSGKLRGQRAKSMKFVDGIMIHSGDPVNDYIDQATRKVLLRQGVLGIKVNIMLPHDPQGRRGPKKPLPDQVEVIEPKEEEPPKTPQTIVRQPQETQQPPQQPPQQQQQSGQQQQQPPQHQQQQQQQQPPPPQQGVPPPQMQMPPQQYQQMGGDQYGMPSGQMPPY